RRCEVRVDPVEEPEQPDPDDPAQHVEPTEERLEEIHHVHDPTSCALRLPARRRPRSWAWVLNAGNSNVNTRVSRERTPAAYVLIRYDRDGPISGSCCRVRA